MYPMVNHDMVWRPKFDQSGDFWWLRGASVTYNGPVNIIIIHYGWHINNRKQARTLSTGGCTSKPSRPPHLSHSPCSCRWTPRLIIIIIGIHHPPQPHPSPPIILPSAKQSSPRESPIPILILVPIPPLPCTVIIVTIISEPSAKSA